jgi:hypothetical protein
MVLVRVTGLLPPRRLAGAAIVAFWVTMTVLLVRRQLPVAPSLPPPTAEVGGETFMEIGTNGRRMGVVHTTRGAEIRNGQPGLRAVMTARVHLSILETPADIEASVDLWHAAAQPRAEITAELVAPGQRVRLVATVIRGNLTGVLSSGGEEVPLSARVDPSLLDPVSFLTAVPLASLSTGQEVRVAGLDPLTLRPTTIRLTLLGEETIQALGTTQRASKVRVVAGGAALTAWVGTRGELLAATTPFGLTLRAISAAEAAAGHEEPVGPDLLAATVVTPSGVRPFRGARRLVIRLSGLDADTLPPEDAFQRLGADGAWTITAESPRAGGASVAGPVPADLAGDPLSPAGHPKIRAQAAAIVAVETDPLRRAEAVNAWVFSNVTKKLSPGLPSALEVLATRSGDCNEHTVLFAALARAASVPTRIAVGVVWSDELDGFAYHAWPEVWASRWVRLDPTLGQEIADATHFKLVEGGIETWPKVLAYLGRLRIDVVEVR